MRIGVVGPLGLPASGGGLTRHAEELCTRLAARGHDVTLFGRSSHVQRSFSYRGVRVVKVPVLRAEGWETLGYGLTASAWAAASRFDVVHYHGIGVTTFCALPKVTGARLVVTVHRIDWADERRPKPVRELLRRAENAAMKRADEVICVSQALRAELQSRHPGRPVHVVPNGVNAPPPSDPALLEGLGLRPDGYIFFAGRLVPEKGVHLLVEAYRALGRPDVDLAIAGGTRHASSYADGLRRAAPDGVRFLGPLSGAVLDAVYAHARVVVCPSLHEGFNLTVLEAMSHGRCVVASDLPVHEEVLGGTGITFRSGDSASLAERLRPALGDLEENRRLGSAARQRALQSGDFDWDRITAATERILQSAAGQSVSR